MSEQFGPHAEMPPELVLSEAEMRRLVEQIEAGIKATEKLERAIATRPQPSAEPVAWLCERINSADGNKPLSERRWVPAVSMVRPIATPWQRNPEPLYPASALEAARREALEQAAKVAVALRKSCAFSGAISPIEVRLMFHTLEDRDAFIDAHIAALKENPNAG